MTLVTIVFAVLAWFGFVVHMVSGALLVAAGHDTPESAFDRLGFMFAFWILPALGFCLSLPFADFGP